MPYFNKDHVTRVSYAEVSSCLQRSSNLNTNSGPSSIVSNTGVRSALGETMKALMVGYILLLGVYVLLVSRCAPPRNSGSPPT